MGDLDAGPSAPRTLAVGPVLETASRLVAACRTTCAEAVRIRETSRELLGRCRSGARRDVAGTPGATPG